MSKAQASAAAATMIPESAPKKGKLMKIIVLLVVLVGVALGGLYVYVEYFEGKAAPEGAQAQGKVHAAAGEPGVMIPLEPFLVNLADVEARRYLKTKMDLEVSPEKAAKEMEKVMPKIRDAIIMILSSKTNQDISQAAGKEKLRQEILTQLGTLPGGQNIKGVYFTEFVTQ